MPQSWRGSRHKSVRAGHSGGRVEGFLGLLGLLGLLGFRVCRVSGSGFRVFRV